MKQEETTALTTTVATMIETNDDLQVQIVDDVLDKDPYDPRFYITDSNKSDMIKYFEKEIRDSFEYKWLIDLFKRVLDVKSCVFFKGYSLENGMKLEFHHHPFTLYDYTEAVVNKQMEDHQDNWVLENEVEKEVALIHYRLMVGLVPLNPTAHAQVHDHVLDIPPELIIGDYDRFYKEYEKFIPENTKIKFKEYLENYPKGYVLEFPENFKYKPTTVIANNKHAITTESIDRLLIGDKLNNINNEYITKYLEELKS